MRRRNFLGLVFLGLIGGAVAGCPSVAMAQVLPGDSPNMGIGAAVSNSRSRPLLGLSRGGEHNAPDYETRTAPPPHRKPPRDPWAGIR